MGLLIGRMTTLVNSFEEEMVLENKNHVWHKQKIEHFRDGMVSSLLYALFNSRNSQEEM